VVTIAGAASGAAVYYLPWGMIGPRTTDEAQIIGMIVGGLAGFILSAAPAVLIFALSEIAENTRQTLLELRRASHLLRRDEGGARAGSREPTL
jgi:hypothetical protein